MVVTVLPVTHVPQRDKSDGIEMPLAVKRHLGLDDAPSWIVLTEGNRSVWPGHDLRKIGNEERFDYGFLPPRFFDKLRNALLASVRARRVQLSQRT